VPRLIDAELSAARKRHLREQTPALVLDWAASDVLRLHILDECLDVVAHQIELVHVVLVGRMHGHFRWRQSENQPSLAHVDVRECEHVAQERAVGTGIRAVDD
jgi:hypothetical protein